MLNLPVLDDQRFEDIVTEAKKRIPQLCAEWTDFNEHDPGITLIELFAWYKQMQQYHLDQITADHLRMFLKLMGIVPEPVRETRANLLAVGKGIQEPFACGERLYSAGGVVFELEESWNPGHVRLCAAYAGRNERPDDITGLLNQWKVFYTLTREETLYLGFSFSGAKTDLELWVEIDDRHPSPRNRPAGPDDPPPRIFVIEAMDGARAVPVQVLRDETFALSFSGSLSLRLKEPLGVSDAGMGLPKFCWLRLRITDPGCEEDPAILGIAAGCGRLVQRRTRAESGDFTVSCGETASVELYTRLAASGERDLFVRDGRGWRLVSAAMEPAVRDGIAGVRCSFSAQDAAQDGAPNVRLCCRERDFAVRRAHTGLPGGRIDLLDGEETAATGCLRLMCARTFADGSVRYEDWTYVDTLEQAGPFDRVYTLDGDGLLFGDNLYGAAPEGGKEAVYLTGFALTDGARGALPHGQALLAPGRGGDEQPQAGAAFYVRPGRDAETPEDAAARLREQWRCDSRAATARDYEQVARRTPGRRVGLVKAIPHYRPENLFSQLEPNTLTLVAAPYSGRPRPLPDQRFLDCVAAQMERYRTVCTRVIVTAPVYVPILVRAEVLSKSGEAETARQAQERLELYFRECEPGAPVLLNDLLGVLGAAESVIGVRRAALTYKGSQCRHSEQGDVLIPKHAVAYLEKLELYVSER